MTLTLAWGLLAVAVLIVVGLALYAFRLWKRVHHREALQRDEIRRANENCLESLDVIARAMLADQVDLIEGALRCKVLLEIIEPQLVERSRFHVFAEVHRRAGHLHTHSARQALSPRQRLEEDRERIALEEELRAPLQQAAHAVVDFKKRWPAGLH
ncbi:DUF2489 domain-containing protein [Halomonas shantousis]